MIEFKRKYSLQNGNRVTKKNWQNVIAVSSKPCTGVLGVPAIEEAKRTKGAYFETWRLVYEDKDPERTGFIFREINHDCGIGGHHKTFKEAVWSAIRKDIRVYLTESKGMSYDLNSLVDENTETTILIDRGESYKNIDTWQPKGKPIDDVSIGEGKSFRKPLKDRW